MSVCVHGELQCPLDLIYDQLPDGDRHDASVFLKSDCNGRAQRLLQCFSFSRICSLFTIDTYEKGKYNFWHLSVTLISRHTMGDKQHEQKHHVLYMCSVLYSCIVQTYRVNKYRQGRKVISLLLSILLERNAT